MNISIIIPVINEEKSLSKLLDYLLNITNFNTVKEIIIVDGGSTDTTVEIATTYPQVRILHSSKGRAIQMNNGAKIAESDILYFLHCDSFPPKNYEIAIISKVNQGFHAGCFKMKFDYKHIVLQVSQYFTKFNFQSCRGGDQSLFIQKKTFTNLKGFNEDLSLYEDNEIIAELYKQYNFTVIQQYIITSARKYLTNGVWTLQFHFFMIHFKHWLGHSNEQLVSYYKKNIR